MSTTTLAQDKEFVDFIKFYLRHEGLHPAAFKVDRLADGWDGLTGMFDDYKRGGSLTIGLAVMHNHNPNVDREYRYRREGKGYTDPAFVYEKYLERYGALINTSTGELTSRAITHEFVEFYLTREGFDASKFKLKTLARIWRIGGIRKDCMERDLLVSMRSEYVTDTYKDTLDKHKWTNPVHVYVMYLGRKAGLYA